MFQTKIVQKIKTCFLRSVISAKVTPCVR